MWSIAFISVRTHAVVLVLGFLVWFYTLLVLSTALFAKPAFRMSIDELYRKAAENNPSVRRTRREVDRGELSVALAKKFRAVAFVNVNQESANLEALKHLMPSVTQNRMRLARMTGTQALDAVIKPGGTLAMDITDGLVRLSVGLEDVDRRRRASRNRGPGARARRPACPRRRPRPAGRDRERLRAPRPCAGRAAGR